MNGAKAVVLLAGGNGRIGTAVARHVLAAGGCVAAAVRKPRQVETLRSTLGRDRVLVGLVGSGDSEAAAGFVKGAHDALGPITMFVGAAGLWQPPAAGREPGGDVADLLAGNLLANAVLARAVLPFLRRRRSGVLAFLGATEASLASGSAAFAASKAALHEFVRALDRDLDGSGVQARALLLDAAHAADPVRVVAQLAAMASGLAPAAPAGGALLSIAT